MKLNNKKILLTGAGGFIGSHTAESLLKRGCKLKVFVRYNSRSEYGWLDTFSKKIINQIEIIAGDLKDADAVSKAVKDCQVVFHLGALIGIPYSYIHPNDYVETNIIGTTNILNSCRDHNIKRLVHVSTSEVYGTAQYVPIDENHPKVGQSPYSASKISADMLVESFNRSFDLPTVIIRPFNTYGPRQSLRAVIPTIISQLLKSSQLSLGEISTTRDFTFVSDTVEGIIKAAEVNKAVGETINLGYGREISIKQLADLIASLLNKRHKFKQESKRKRPENSEVNRLLSDNSKAKEILGWEPKIDLEKGLKKTIIWLKENLTQIDSGKYYT